MFKSSCVAACSWLVGNSGMVMPTWVERLALSCLVILPAPGPSWTALVECYRNRQ